MIDPSTPGFSFMHLSLQSEHVGKNYVAHIQELSTVLDTISADIPEEPLIFIKSGGTLLLPPPGQPCAQTQEEVAALPLQPLPLPVHWSDDVQHEVELAVELGPGLQPLRAAVCLDMTARDAQRRAASKGHPWALGKSFPAATPIGATFPVESEADLRGLHIQLQVEELVQYLKSRFPIEAGDLILTVRLPTRAHAMAEGAPSSTSSFGTDRDAAVSEGQQPTSLADEQAAATGSAPGTPPPAQVASSKVHEDDEDVGESEEAGEAGDMPAGLPGDEALGKTSP
ncbi:hypothetical protein QJQ45_005192 [Haematococcus lacustris]|nr:hypothetical protein QJQ45_005192 [Haematococcus lacustris]